MNFTVDKSLIEKKVKKISKEIGINDYDYDIRFQLQSNNLLIRQVQEENGLEEGNKVLRSSIPGYYWEADLIKKESDSDSTNDEDSHSERDQSNIKFQFDLHGNLLHFKRQIADSEYSTPLGLDMARIKAKIFIQQYTKFEIDRESNSIVDTAVTTRRIMSNDSETVEEIQEREKRNQKIDYEFQWQTFIEGLGNRVELQLTISGNRISLFDVDYKIPEEFKGKSDKIASGVLEALCLIAISIIVIIAAFRKIRNYEISFRLASFLGLIVSIFFGLNYYFISQSLSRWELALSLSFTSLFIGGIFIILMAVSESIGREIWQDKFVPLDLIMKGHILHSRIGLGIIQGIAFGTLSFVTLQILTWVLSKFFPLRAIINEEFHLNCFSSSDPAISVLSYSLWKSFYILTANFIFIISLIHQKITRRKLTLILSAAPLGILLGGTIQPIYIGIIIESIALLVIVWAFYRFDILTTFFALVTFITITCGFAFAYAGNTTFINDGYVIVAVFCGIFLYAVYSAISPDRVSDFKEVEPSLSKFISERQRMKQQLDIARNVQMSLLPQTTPIFKGLEIASKCLPAYEVGGDYYDFIKLNKNQIGVAIGDVSGKGTSAAFYMTLVKGFLKALARVSHSPAEVLKEINFLFFENAKRDAFISMIYAIFDMEKNSLVLARSGHNPVMMYNAKEQIVNEIKASGLALGLEKGELFNRLMQEVEIPFSSGDLFLFYTDGFTEAMNKNQEEFGENRLEEMMKKYATLPSDQILKNLFTEVSHFTKKAKQHDDMSIVVVKVI